MTAMMIRSFIFLALLLKFSLGSHPGDVCPGAAGAQCGSCGELPVLSDPAIIPPQTFFGTLSQTLSKNSAGCVVLTVTCTAPATAAQTLLIFLTNNLLFANSGTVQTLTCDDYGNLLSLNPVTSNSLNVDTFLCIYG